MNTIKLHTFVFNAFYENTYVIWDEISKEGVVVDPGMSDEKEEEAFDAFIKNNNISLKYLFNTHGHIDHVLGNAYVKKKYSIEFWFPKEDEFILNMLDEIGNNYGISTTPSPAPDKYFEEKSDLKLGNVSIVLIFTPGHSPGEYCFYFKEAKICITGDVLFEEGIGRTDLWGGNYNTLINSIKDKLLVLPHDTKIYPGHGNSSSIGFEIEANPYL